MTAATSARTSTIASTWRTTPASRRARRDSQAHGKLRGIGISNTVEASNAGLIEHAELRFDPTGTLTVSMGTHDHGQGHATTFRQIIADKLGIPPERVRFQYGDTDQVAIGTGTFGSRSMACGGTALLIAADKIIAKGKKLAAHMLEAAEHDIVFEKGKFIVAGTDKRVELAEIAKTLVQPQGAAAGHGGRPVRERHLRRRRAHLSRTAATSSRSRSTRRPARSRSCAITRSTTSAT